MKNVPKPVQAALLVVVLAIAGFAGWKVLIAPQRQEAAALERQIDDVHAQITEAQTAGPGSDVQPIRVADLFHLSRAMPDRPDLPAVLLQLSAIASETGVNFESITPHDPELTGGYSRIPIDLAFQGHFYDLSDFLYRLRNLVGVHSGELDATGRLFSVDSIAFAEGDLKFPQVRATLTVDAFMFGDGTQPPLPPLPAPDPSASPGAAPTETGETPIPAVPQGAAAVGELPQ